MRQQRKVLETMKSLADSCTGMKAGDYDGRVLALACSYCGSVALLSRFVNARMLRSNALNLPFICLSTLGLGIIPSYCFIQSTRLASAQQTMFKRMKAQNVTE